MATAPQLVTLESVKCPVQPHTKYSLTKLEGRPQAGGTT